MVAIVVAEGTVQRVHMRDDAPAIDGRPVEQPIAALCEDVRRRLPQENGKAPTMATIQRALTARAKALKPPKRDRAAERYTRQVTRLYLELCGAESTWR